MKLYYIKFVKYKNNVITRDVNAFTDTGFMSKSISRCACVPENYRNTHAPTVTYVV